MKKLYPLLSVLFLIIPLSNVQSQNNIGINDGVLPYGDNIGINDGVLPYGDNIGIHDGVLQFGENIYLTDNYSPQKDELDKVYVLNDGVLPYGDNIGINDGVLPYGDNIGINDGILQFGDNYGFTNKPELSDIIIVVDLDLIIKILSGHSVFKTIIKNYNSSEESKKVEELLIVEIKRDGEIIFLSNGSIYEVLYQSYETSLWSPYSSVFLINDNQIINPDWNSEKIDVYKIK